MLPVIIIGILLITEYRWWKRHGQYVKACLTIENEHQSERAMSFLQLSWQIHRDEVYPRLITFGLAASLSLLSYQELLRLSLKLYLISELVVLLASLAIMLGISWITAEKRLTRLRWQRLKMLMNLECRLGLKAIDYPFSDEPTAVPFESYLHG